MSEYFHIFTTNKDGDILDLSKSPPLRQLSESDLYCGQRKNSLPVCIATDLSMCPECKFPACRSEFLKLVEDGVVCSMCVETLATSDIKVLSPSMLRTGNEETEEKVEEGGRPVTGSSRGSSRMSKL